MTAYNGLHKKEDMIGLRFNKWKVLDYSHKNKQSGNWYYFCVCDCGNQKVVSGTNLRTGISTQCKSCSNKTNGRKGLYSQTKGDLYMIRVQDYVKIGVSQDVQRRIKDIGSSSPFDAILVYHGIGEAKDEELWHNIFKHRHHKGEWFYMPAGHCEI
jgi:hypothetical protein